MKPTKKDLKEIKRISLSLPSLVQYKIKDKKIIHPYRIFWVYWPQLITLAPEVAKQNLEKVMHRKLKEDEVPLPEHDSLFKHGVKDEFSKHWVQEEVIIFQNHKRMLMKRFSVGGWKAVAEYIKEVREKDITYKTILKEVASLNKENAS